MDTDFANIVASSGGDRTKVDMKEAIKQLVGICVKECPQVGDTIKDVADGDFKGGWTEKYKTFSFMGRCFEDREEVLASDVYCESPTCDVANKPCVDMPGGNEPNSTWLIHDDDDEDNCDVAREIKQISQPAGGLDNPLYNQIYDQ